MRRLSPAHASLSGQLPEQPFSPPAEGKRPRTLRQAVEALGTETLPHSDDEPLWMLEVADIRACIDVEREKVAEAIAGRHRGRLPGPGGVAMTAANATASNIEAARAILSGGQMPEGARWEGVETRLESACREMLRGSTGLSIGQLAQFFSDWTVGDDEDATYNALSPVERALDEVFYTLDCGIEEGDIRNPIFLYELRQAQRRTLERLLAMADQEVSYADR